MHATKRKKSQQYIGWNSNKYKITKISKNITDSQQQRTTHSTKWIIRWRIL